MLDTTREFDGELERRLRAFASERLSPDAWASVRMRATVIEHGRELRAKRAERRLGFNILMRRGATVGLVSVIAIATGTTAALAASPGGPLYGVRLQIEAAFLPYAGPARTNAEIGLLNERTGEITDAVQAGNDSAAKAAADAYGSQVDEAVSSAGGSADVAARRAELLSLRATLVRQLNHFQSLIKPNDRSSSNLNRLIARTQAAIAAVDAKLRALPAS